MKRLVLVDIPYGCALVMPGELTGFLPTMEIVTVDGYGSTRKLIANDTTISFEFIEGSLIQPQPKPDPPPPPAPKPEPSVPTESSAASGFGSGAVFTDDPEF